jgi:hypothetical protein
VEKALWSHPKGCVVSFEPMRLEVLRRTQACRIISHLNEFLTACAQCKEHAHNVKRKIWILLNFFIKTG